ncbi:hypothetical protein H310_03281 [Aphanomyces invadans]|uniref:Uncharacterized protein n=1 Tax=Aphanomyces invadans TaxID=157072 RepID=A0A024UH56_9STRA|nr:hypothetical protein H310_03281 [Aphanomyces invadans]ETW05525.1 hypothetical protein H310_03281 [Aphanomyces invadans]|eukprot:XP_008865302.1 hypothetical protein H310_03281 [Aphanomyces invadans]
MVARRHDGVTHTNTRRDRFVEDFGFPLGRGMSARELLIDPGVVTLMDDADVRTLARNQQPKASVAERIHHCAWKWSREWSVCGLLHGVDEANECSRVDMCQCQRTCAFLRRLGCRGKREEVFR